MGAIGCLPSLRSSAQCKTPPCARFSRSLAECTRSDCMRSMLAFRSPVTVSMVSSSSRSLYRRACCFMHTLWKLSIRSGLLIRLPLPRPCLRPKPIVLFPASLPPYHHNINSVLRRSDCISLFDSGRQVRFSSPLPDDFVEAMVALGFRPLEIRRSMAAFTPETVEWLSETSSDNH